MTGFLLDTNVISELSRPDRNPTVVGWVQGLPNAYLSVLTLGEIERGAWLCRKREPRYSARLSTWLGSVESAYADGILPIDRRVMSYWASIPTTRTLSTIDSLLAATALAHDLTVATRNVRDFDGTGVRVVNPFEDQEPTSAPWRRSFHGVLTQSRPTGARQDTGGPTRRQTPRNVTKADPRDGVAPTVAPPEHVARSTAPQTRATLAARPRGDARVCDSLCESW
ncbi:MAG: type II toxin-antitoxin system VapC family toxin [Tessaracoccus sp.]|uniref:type II toxin-antitoxin system VapC family toxin n=1 Tax=Tessaracoccus sp. TaxID=1971211 RepID=UPI001EBEFB37|nr:type II toxin-antitoxin system VapC family toxin [Tessaracoccus sp.]